MHVWKLASALMLLCVGTGCATVLRGDKQKVKFETDPPVANLSVDGKDYKTPIEVTLKRKDTHNVIVSLPRISADPVRSHCPMGWRFDSEYCRARG